MRRFYLMMFLLAGLTFISCDNESRIVYSCDPTEDEWVHDNLDEIRSMTRTHWEGLAENLKRPVLAAFTPEQRVCFWSEKFENALLLDWNDAEKEHIDAVIKYITLNPEIFQGFKYLSDEKKDEFEIFFYSWREKASNEFGWSQELIASMIQSPNTLLDKNGTVATTLNVATRATRSEGSSASKSKCHCSSKSDWCNGPAEWGECEKTDKCEEVEDNCGTLLVYTCDGRCGGI